MFSSAACIEPVEFNSAEVKILNTLTKSTCMTLKAKSQGTESEVTRLTVNKTCNTGSDVSIIQMLNKFSSKGSVSRPRLNDVKLNRTYMSSLSTAFLF